MSSKVLCIGAGNMGSAIITSAIQKGVFQPDTTFILDQNSHKVQHLQKELGIQEGNPGDCSHILLAVKPQSLGSVFPLSVTKNPLLISVLAGVSCRRIQEASGIEAICRVMPNTPAMIGAGMSGMFFSEKVSDDDRSFSEKIFQACGEIVEVSLESDLHAVTALSGSGPAYFFCFVEHMISAGERLGLAPEVCEKLACQTFFGAGQLLHQSGESPEELRKKVTSKGGTTQAALDQFGVDDFKQIVHSALLAAYARSQEL